MSVLQTHEPPPAVGVRPFRVLVVDDDELQLRALQRVLRGDHRIELVVADNAIDAMLHVGAIKPDLVVMDVFMPGLDGIEACRRIKANPDTRNIQIVLASASMTPDLEAAAQSAGAREGITKPFVVPTLLGPLLDAAPAVAPVIEAVPIATTRGADLIVNMLAEAGVDTIFGLPGGAISPIHDALLDSNIRVVTTRHESGAMFAAAGYAHTTGRLGVVAVTSGPGALNAMTGLASAWCDGLPVLLLVGEVPRVSHGKGVLQDGSSHGLQIVEMFRHVAKLAVEVPRPSALPHLVRRAIATALSGRRGPVVLTLPLDVTTAQVATPRIGGAVTLGEIVSPATLDEITDLLAGAEHPLILAGSGIRGGTAPVRLRAVAERFKCPVATTPKAKGVFPENHPLALGVLGLGGHTSARDYLRDADVVLAIGTSLGDMATDGFSPYLQASRALIHVDIDARQIGKSYSPTHAVVASAAELLGGLVDRIELRPPSEMIRPLLGDVARHILPATTLPNRIAPQDAIREIQALLPRDTIFTVDSGEHFLFATQYLESTYPDAFVVMTGLGSMGQSIGAAIGSQLGHPERVVAAICGDGCFAMNAFEVATAVAERIPIIVFVFNDQRLGMVENGHQTVYGRHPTYPTNPLDVCMIARGLGAATLRVDSSGQLAKAAELIRTTSGPIVIDVQIDPTIIMPKRDRVATMTPGRIRSRSIKLKLVN